MFIDTVLLIYTDIMINYIPGKAQEGFRTGVVLGRVLKTVSISHKNTYRKFSIKGAGRGGKPLGGALIRERGHFHLPVAFYRMKIGLFLAEIWPKTSRNPMALGSKGGAPL